MRSYVTIVWAAVAVALAACGGSEEPVKKEERQAITPENNAFGTLVGAPKKVEESTEAAADQYRDSMNRRLEQDEGGAREEPAGD
jgi:hypothetical protein